MLIPPVSAAVLDDYLDLIDGLLVPGGADVDSSLYGEEAHHCLGSVDPELDRMEMRLLEHAFDRDLPILGICRGIQSLAVALGGALYQDLPTQIPGLTHELRENDRSFLAHDISISQGSRLESILGKTSIGVNSLHHQSVRMLPQALRAVARSEDGIIEAVEAPRKRFVVGLQCHPEELWESTEPAFSRVFAAFLHEAARLSTLRPAVAAR